MGQTELECRKVGLVSRTSAQHPQGLYSRAGETRPPPPREALIGILVFPGNPFSGHCSGNGEYILFEIAPPPPIYIYNGGGVGGAPEGCIMFLDFKRHISQASSIFLLRAIHHTLRFRQSQSDQKWSLRLFWRNGLRQKNSATLGTVRIFIYKYRTGGGLLAYL